MTRVKNNTYKSLKVRGINKQRGYTMIKIVSHRLRKCILCTLIKEYLICVLKRNIIVTEGIN